MSPHDRYLAPEASPNSLARSSGEELKRSAPDTGRAKRFGLLNACFDLVTHALARMLTVRGVPGGNLLVVLADAQDALGRQLTRRIGVVMHAVDELGDELKQPFDACATPLRMQLAHRVFEGLADIMRFLMGEVPSGWTRVLLIAAGGWR